MGTASSTLAIVTSSSLDSGTMNAILVFRARHDPDGVALIPPRFPLVFPTSLLSGPCTCGRGAPR